MGSKKCDPVQWWDRGRERWRSRPEKKERSLDECVGGRRRPTRETYARRDPSVRAALRLYCEDRDEDALDQRLVREKGPAPWWLRWRASVRRRHHIADLQQGVWGFLRKVAVRRSRWLPSECLRFAAYQAADWTERFAMQDELLDVLMDFGRAPPSRRVPISEDPRLVRRIAVKSERIKIAKRLLRVHCRWQREAPERVVPAALWPLVDTRRAEYGEPERKPMHKWIAIMFAEMFGWLPVGYAQQHWRSVRWGAAAVVLDVIEKDPALRAAVEKWTALNLADARVIASELRAHDHRSRR